LGGEHAADVGAVVAADPVGVLLEVDERDADQPVVEGDREVLVERLTDAADPRAPAGDPRRDPLEGAAAGSCEGEPRRV